MVKANFFSDCEKFPSENENKPDAVLAVPIDMLPDSEATFSRPIAKL
jgi:hypothetical protein